MTSLKLKKYIRKTPWLMHGLSMGYRLFMMNWFQHRGISREIRGAFIKKTKVKSNGKNNHLFIREGCRIDNSVIRFFGDNNIVEIDHDCALHHMDIWISDGSTIYIGNHSHTGETHIACIEGTNVTIGERCLFSDHIVIRTGDSHSIINSEGQRINKSRSITIGDHVWIGQGVTILKGSSISDDTVIGANSLVTGKEFPASSIIAGNPARVIKEHINWDPKLIRATSDER